MKKASIVFSLLFSMWTGVIAQSVGIGTTTPASSAQLDVSSTNKGFLPPRMTTAQRDAITSPATGLIIFNTTTNGLEIRNRWAWILLSPAADALPTIQIGTQKWMNKNLDVAFYRNGDPIPEVTDPTAWSALTTGAWCYYNYDPIQGGKYGKLYNWYAVNDPRGLAPHGWHVPSDAEWTALATTLGVSAGGKMKEAGTLNWTSPNKGANNNSGWAGLPGGFRFTWGANTAFSGASDYGYWWSDTEYNTELALGVACSTLMTFYPRTSMRSRMGSLFVASGINLYDSLDNLII